MLTLNAYLNKCLNIIYSFDEFVIRHLPREENGQANALAQQASGYIVEKGKFNIRRPMRTKAELHVRDELVRPVDPTGLTAEPGLTGPETGLTAQSAGNTDSVTKETEDQDWRVCIISYLKDPGRGAERNIPRAAFKYVLIDNELYRRTAEDLLLKCLDRIRPKWLWEEFMKASVALINRLLK